jgi:hypothetical protein
MMKSGVERIPFAAGDNVVVTRGSYAGTRVVFLKLRKDPNWADVREPGGGVRSHPLDWLMLELVGSSVPS